VICFIILRPLRASSLCQAIQVTKHRHDSLLDRHYLPVVRLVMSTARNWKVTQRLSILARSCGRYARFVRFREMDETLAPSNDPHSRAAAFGCLIYIVVAIALGVWAARYSKSPRAMESLVQFALEHGGATNIPPN
jgi:hypothetical protein